MKHFVSSVVINIFQRAIAQGGKTWQNLKTKAIAPATGSLRHGTKTPTPAWSDFGVSLELPLYTRWKTRTGTPQTPQHVTRSLALTLLHMMCLLPSLRRTPPHTRSRYASCTMEPPRRPLIFRRLWGRLPIPSWLFMLVATLLSCWQMPSTGWTCGSGTFVLLGKICRKKKKNVFSFPCKRFFFFLFILLQIIDNNVIIYITWLIIVSIVNERKVVNIYNTRSKIERIFYGIFW